MSIGIEPYEFSIKMYQGDFKQLEIAIRDNSTPPNPIRPSTLDDVWFTAKIAPGSGNANTFQHKLTTTGITISDDANGLCLVDIAPADTSSLAADGNSVVLTCYVKLIDGSSNPFTLRVGQLTVLPE